MADMGFASAAPDGDANGLAPYVSDLLNGARSGKLWPVIGVIDCAGESIDYRKGGRKPKAGFRRIEIVLPEDRKAAARIMARALEHRTGKAVLPLDLEDQIEAAFGAVDPDHPDAEDDDGEGGSGDR
jgi:hypothetical protein